MGLGNSLSFSCFAPSLNSQKKGKTFGGQTNGALILFEIISFRVTVNLLVGALYNDISFFLFAEVPLRHQTAEKVAILLRFSTIKGMI